MEMAAVQSSNVTALSQDDVHRMSREKLEETALQLSKQLQEQMQERKDEGVFRKNKNIVLGAKSGLRLIYPLSMERSASTH